MRDRRQPVLRVVARFILWCMAWQMETDKPQCDRYVLIGGPHTSNWDYVIFLCFMLILEIDIKVMVKDDLFVWPFRTIMRWAGVIPINRRESRTQTQQVVDLYEKNESMVVMITPEGTRKLVERWRSGFYFIAEGAKVPIIMAYVDYGRRRAGFSAQVWPSGNCDDDIEQWQAFYFDKLAKHPGLQLRPNS